MSQFKRPKVDDGKTKKRKVDLDAMAVDKFVSIWDPLPDHSQFVNVLPFGSALGVSVVEDLKPSFVADISFDSNKMCPAISDVNFGGSPPMSLCVSFSQDAFGRYFLPNWRCHGFR